MIVGLVTTAIEVPALFLVGAGAAVLATLSMDLVMPRITEGATPPRVASGVLTNRPPREASRRLAAVVHYVAGGLTGPVYVWLTLAVMALVGGGELASVAVGVGLYPLMVGFFVVIVLPRATGLSGRRRRRIALAWALEALVYVIVLVPVVIAGGRLL